MTTKRMDIYGSGVIQYPVVAELNVADVKVTGTAIGSSQNMALEDVKNNAVVDAIKKANADVLIEPIFETEVKKGEIKVQVTGFPGKYEKFRPATIDDVPLLDMGILQKATVAEPKNQEKIGGSGLVWAAIGGIGLLGVIMALI